MEKLLVILNTILKNRKKKELIKLEPELRLREDIGLDSLDLAEMTVRIEYEYKVDVFSDGNIFTIGEVLNKIDNE